MPITFEALNQDHEVELIEFLTANTFPFHVRRSLTAEEARTDIESGRYWNPDSQGYWIFDNGELLGLVVLEDLDEDAPLFDLRLAEEHRDNGHGVPVLEALCAKVFSDFPEIVRFEGQTREDNLPMRKVFRRAGFLKEAHYRMGWPVADGRRVASVGYAILRQDWETGETTTFDWDDLEIPGR